MFKHVATGFLAASTFVVGLVMLVWISIQLSLITVVRLRFENRVGRGCSTR